MQRQLMHDDLGIGVKDIITGFEGVMTGFVYYLSGCNQALVNHKVGADGKLISAEWFDQQRLVETDPNKVELNNAETPGFDVAPHT